MRKASIRDLHNRTSELVREAAGGTVIRIERREEPIVELHPVARKMLKRKLPDMRKIWQRLPTATTDSGRFLEEDR